MKTTYMNFAKRFAMIMAVAMMAVNVWGADPDESVTFSAQGYENQQAITSYQGTYFSIAFDKGDNSNAPKYFTSGTAIRAYAKNTITVSSSTKTLAKIVLVYGEGGDSNTISASKDGFTESTGIWEGSASSVTFTIGGTSGNRRIAGIAVTYEFTGYAVTYESDYGTAPSGTTAANVTLPNMPNVTGYTFLGWKADKNVTNTSTSATITAGTLIQKNTNVTLSGATTFTAQWELNKYTVSFAVNVAGYGTVSASSVANVPHGTVPTSSDNTVTVNVTTITATPTTSDDEYVYAFSGWTGVPASVTDACTITANFTRTARTYKNYRVSCAELYSITYDANGATGAVPTDDTEYGPSDDVTVADADNLAMEHYTFAGWNTEAEGTGISIAAGATINLSENTTLYAQWTCAEKVTVSAGTPEHGSFELSQTGAIATCDGEVVITVTNIVPSTGYEFDDISATSGTVNKAAKTVTFEQYANGTSTINVTFKAKTITVTWNANGGSVATASSEYTYDGAAVELPNPTRDNYTFLGWFTAANGGTEITEIGTANKPSADIEYYAHWELKKYTITWMVGTTPLSGAVALGSASVLVSHGGTISALPPTPTIALGDCADTFRGWSLEELGNEDGQNAPNDMFTTASGASSITITQNTTFHAVFATQTAAPSTALVKMTAGQTLANGDEVVIVANGTEYALYQETVNSTWVKNWEFTGTDPVMSDLGNDAKKSWIVTQDGDKWKFGDATNGYLYNSSSNDLSVPTGNSSSWTLGDKGDGTFTLKAVNMLACRTELTSENVNNWRGGGSTGSNGTSALLIYKKVSTPAVYENHYTKCIAITCGVPSGANATPTGNGATLSWTASEVGTPDHYEYAVWADGDAEPTDNYSTTSTNSASVSGLMSSTTYNWKVRAVCGENDESKWLKNLSFTTTAVNLTFNVPEGVSAVTEQTSETALPSADVPASCGNCWAFVGWSENANCATAPEYAAGETYKFNNNKTLYAVYSKAEYKLISTTSELVANNNYVLTFVNGENEYALSNTKIYTHDASVTDVTNKVRKIQDDYYIYNVSANNIWKFTGTASEGQLYNAAADKFINLSSTSSDLLNTTDNLTFTVDNKVWIIKSTNYLHPYGTSSYEMKGSLSDDDYSAYIYRQISAEYATAPDCSGMTVKWYVIDTETPAHIDNNVSTCTGIESLPAVDVADVRCKTEGTVFMGWSETNIGYTPISDADAIAALNLFKEVEDAPAITGDKSFYAVFAEGTPANPESATVTYAITGKSTISASGTAPQGSGTTTLSETCSTSKQMTGGTSQTLTLKAWAGQKITGIVLSMKSNSGSGTGSLSYSTDGGANFREIANGAFNSSAWYGSWSTSYVNVTKNNLNIVCGDGDVVIKIAASANSLYCESYAITYEEVVEYSDYFTECCPQKSITLSGVDNTVGKHFEADLEAACAGDVVTLTKTENGYYNWTGFTVKDENNQFVDVAYNMVTGESTFTMPATAVTVTATWTAKNYIATVNEPDPAVGSVTITGGTIVNDERQVAYGGELTVTATAADDDHYFIGWTIEPAITGYGSQNPMTITMPGNNVEITANFGAVAYSALTLGSSSLSATLENGDEIPNMGSIRAGTTIKVTYTPDGQKELTGWTYSTSVIPSENGNTVTFNMPGEAMTVGITEVNYYILSLSAEHGSISGVSINNEAHELAAEYRVYEADVVALTATPENDTYKFDSWECTGATITNGSLTVGTSDISVTAKFVNKSTYDVTLIAMGKTHEVIEAQLEGASIWSIISSKTAPVLTDYTFMGWSKDENDASAIIDENSSDVLSAATTLYALYSLKPMYYTKVTSTEDITNGQYLIVYEEGEVAFNGGLTTLDAGQNGISVDINNNRIEISDATTAAEFTINATAGTILSASGKYIGRTSGNGLDESSTTEYTNTLSIEDGKAVIKGTQDIYLRYNSNTGSSSERFRYYSSTSQKDIQLYKREVAGAEEANPVRTVVDGETLTINANKTYADLVIKNGGIVDIESGTLTVNDLTIQSTSGASGQVLGSNVTVNGNIYMDVTFYKTATVLDETSANQWYMISAPFAVNLNGGFLQTNGTPMVFGTDFDLFEYDGNKRATTGTTGWKRAQGKMNAGVACLIGFNADQPTTIRLKAASTEIEEKTSISLQPFAGDDDNKNWNGVANPTLHYTNVSHDVQVYENEDGEHGRKYNVYEKDDYSFVVGTAFFVQATGSIDLEAASHSEFRAPKRAEAEKCYKARVRIFRQEATEFADQIYIRASENASNEYEQGHDMITWNGTTGNTAMLWAENYGMRLAIEEAPLVNDKASYELGIFAPAEGTYRIEANDSHENATLYLTYNDRAIWNLSMSACEVELTKGLNEGYGLKLVVKAPQTPTGIEDVQSSEIRVQKVVLDEKVFILRGGKMYDVTGKAVK